jgi:hypothetical protein
MVSLPFSAPCVHRSHIQTDRNMCLYLCIRIHCPILCTCILSNFAGLSSTLYLPSMVSFFCYTQAQAITGTDSKQNSNVHLCLHGQPHSQGTACRAHWQLDLISSRSREMSRTEHSSADTNIAELMAPRELPCQCCLGCSLACSNRNVEKTTSSAWILQLFLQPGEADRSHPPHRALEKLVQCVVLTSPILRRSAIQGLGTDRVLVQKHEAHGN